MWISEAKSRKATRWKNREVTWQSFIAELRSRDPRTSETMAEYAKMPKEERSRIKDAAGGFVGGQLKDGRRKKENVVSRSMITLDADYSLAGGGTDGWKHDWIAFTCLHDDTAGVCYPTHSSTRDKPRLRWILPASREMTPDEYPAVARKVAEWIGIKTMDKSTFDLNRMFYYPGVPSDAPYELLVNEGEPVDVDEVLSSYGADEAWKDASLWPTCPDEKTLIAVGKAKAGDPTTKPGIVGLFCRTYDVPAAIDEFLPDVYEQCAIGGEQRYTYLKGSTAAGAVVYDNGTFLYSNHATDPAGGHSVNAFDLVRIHKFGELDADDEEGTPVTKLQSYEAMSRWAAELPDVRRQSLEESREDFRDLIGGGPGENADAGASGGGGEEGQAPPPFIELGARGEPKINPTKLAEYVRHNLRYRLVCGGAAEGMRVFVYEKGVYRLHSPLMFLGQIKRFVEDVAPGAVTMRPIREAYDQITTDLCYSQQEDLDSDEGIINFQNGLLRLSDMQLLPHSPDVLSTIQIPCAWAGEQKETPEFDRFMSTLTNEDREIQQLLLEVMGVAISNVPGFRMKKALFLVGDGNTGKSQLRLLTERLIGTEKCRSTDLSDLEARFGTANLYGKRLVGSPDAGFMTVQELRVFKKITAGDTIDVEFKGQNRFSYTFSGVLWLCMNQLPKFGGDDGQWVYDRIMPVRCVNVIPEEKQDKRLLDKLYAEREGIVYKVVQALKRVIANGYRYDIPESVIEEREKYMQDNNSVLGFYAECMCEIWPDEKPDNYGTTSRVHAVYQAWCRENERNGYAKPLKEFSRTLAAHRGIAPEEFVERRKPGSFYKGIRLTADAKQKYSGWYDCLADPDLRADLTTA